MAVVGHLLRCSVNSFAKVTRTSTLLVNQVACRELRPFIQTPCVSISAARCASTKPLTTQDKLMRFFDDKDNWGESSVKVGRPWRTDELRLKSNEDLHKLWYVLLKERNMLLTMEAEYERESELFPSPERMEKVEESMENIIEVINERDDAVKQLETGEPLYPPKVWDNNAIGIAHWRIPTEHYVPKFMHKTTIQRKQLHGKWLNRYFRLLQEKKLRKILYRHRRSKMDKQALREKFPDAELD